MTNHDTLKKIAYQLEYVHPVAMTSTEKEICKILVNEDYGKWCNGEFIGTTEHKTTQIDTTLWKELMSAINGVLQCVDDNECNVVDVEAIDKLKRLYCYSLRS